MRLKHIGQKGGKYTMYYVNLPEVHDRQQSVCDGVFVSGICVLHGLAQCAEVLASGCGLVVF